MREYVQESNVRFDNDNTVPSGFVKISCQEDCINALQHKKGPNFETKHFFKRVERTDDDTDKSNSRDIEYYLHPNKTLQWFCKLVKEATEKITTRDLKDISSFSKVPKVLNQQGPSQKIQVNLNTESKKSRLLDVDLVIAFKFDINFYNPMETRNDSLRELKYEEHQRPYLFVIPKILQSKKKQDIEKKCGTTSKSDSLNWRIDFHDQERIILDSDKFSLAKSVIKIVKLYKYVNALKVSKL